MDPNQYYPTEEEEKGFKAHLLDYFQTLVVIGAIFALIYLFVAQPHKVSGNSMVPTLLNGDYILTDKVTYRFNSPQRGQIIVLKNPRDKSVDFIKRIIAIPGDSIKIENNFVYLNGQQLLEKYLPTGTLTTAGSFLHDGETINIALNQYIVLGDNRQHSSDSREWGPITKEEIIGRAFFRYFPLPRVKLLIGL